MTKLRSTSGFFDSISATSSPSNTSSNTFHYYSGSDGSLHEISRISISSDSTSSESNQETKFLEDKCIVTSEDIQQLCDKYDNLKTPNCRHPVSKFIKQLKEFNRTLIPNVPLNEERLNSLADILKAIIIDREHSPLTFDVSERLRDKMHEYLPDPEVIELDESEKRRSFSF